jgi:hypothetical protein
MHLKDSYGYAQELTGRLTQSANLPGAEGFYSNNSIVYDDITGLRDQGDAT